MRYIVFVILIFVKSQLGVLAQSESEAQELCFQNVSMGLHHEDFLKALSLQSFQVVAKPRYIDFQENKYYLKGRYEHKACEVEVGVSPQTQTIDTLKIYFTQVNNPLVAYRAMNSFYSEKYASKIFDNYYDTHLSAKESCNFLALEPYVSAFAVAGGIVQLNLRYDKEKRRYDFFVLYVSTDAFVPVLQNEDEVIEW